MSEQDHIVQAVLDVLIENAEKVEEVPATLSVTGSTAATAAGRPPDGPGEIIETRGTAPRRYSAARVAPVSAAHLV